MRYLKLVICCCAIVVATSHVFAVPPYPYEARRAHMSGSALYEVHLKPDRTISKIVVAKSCGFRILDDYGAAILSG